jgi:hypothetical protein
VAQTLVCDSNPPIMRCTHATIRETSAFRVLFSLFRSTEQSDPRNNTKPHKEGHFVSCISWIASLRKHNLSKGTTTKANVCRTSSLML